jgi:hypothetical protein
MGGADVSTARCGGMVGELSRSALGAGRNANEIPTATITATPATASTAPGLYFLT